MKNLLLIPEFRRRLATLNTGTLTTTRIIKQGTDIGYIQELLGHSSSKTTENFIHITKKGFENIKNPFDSLGIQKNNNVLFSPPKK